MGSALLLACVLSAAAPSLPQTVDAWPRFRGPNGNGAAEAEHPPATWAEKDYRWRITLPGSGHSSPVIWGDRVFVTVGDEKGPALSVCAFATLNGKSVWSQAIEIEKFKKNQLNSYASSTPALDGKRLYVSWASPEHYVVTALNQADGKPLWRHDLGGFQGEHGFGGSPIVYDDLVIVAREHDGPSSIVALDAATGKPRWTTERKTQKAAYSTPVVFQRADGPKQLVFTSWAHGFYALDPATGKELWELPVFHNRLVGSPSTGGGLVLAAAGTGGGGKQFFAVRPGDGTAGGKAEVAYEVTPPIPYVPTPLCHDGRAYLFGDGGVVTCIKLDNGEVLWRERLNNKFFGSPIRVGGKIYCIARDGKVAVLDATAEFHAPQWVDLGEASHSTPAAAGGTLYFRTLTHLMALPVR